MIDNPTLGWWIWDDFTTFGTLGSVNTLTDSTTGSATDTLDDTTSSVKDDLASLAAKVNLALNQSGAPYKMFRSAGGTIVPADERAGVITLSSDGDNEGAIIGTSMLPFQIDRDLGRFACEFRIKTSTITDTKHGFLLGLMDTASFSATVPIAAAGTLADENFVGFHRLEGDGDYVDTVYKADGVTQVTVKADAKVLVADTFIKLGMRFNPEDNILRFYANGVELPDTKTIPTADGTDFPNDVRMGLFFAVLNATGTTPGNSSIDWWRANQVPADNVT
jgi:hypothetical protein